MFQLFNPQEFISRYEKYKLDKAYAEKDNLGSTKEEIGARTNNVCANLANGLSILTTSVDNEDLLVALTSFKVAASRCDEIAKILESRYEYLQSELKEKDTDTDKKED